MPDEVGSGGEQVVATPAIKESLDAVQQAAFDECMRNRANQIPDELPVTTEAECLRVASQVNLTNESSSGDQIEPYISEEWLANCAEEKQAAGGCLEYDQCEDDCREEWHQARKDAKDQVIESYSEYMQKCQQEFGKPIEECEKLWQTYAGQISTAKLMGGDAKDQGVEEERVSHLDDCLSKGFSEEECANRWEEFLRRWPIPSGDAKDQDLAKAARNYPNTSEGYQSFLSDGCGYENVEDCVQAWEQTYGSRFDTRFDTPTVGVKKDGKWEKHKDRPYTKKPE